jgi:hypothetical protein
MGKNEQKEERIRRVREKRMRLAQERESADKRVRHGKSIVAKVNSALGTRLTLDAFNAKGELPVQLDTRPNFADYQGLVAAHISEKRIRELVACCDTVVSPVAGVLQFDEYRFIGTTLVGLTSLRALLDLAKTLHDSVIFCPEGANSVVLLDHYEVSGMPRDVNFSVVVQGTDLESKLAKCFESVVKFERSK